MVSLPLSYRNNPKTYPHGLHSSLRLILRFFQFVLALTVCGLYGIDLHRAHDANVSADGKWVFAVVVGAASAVLVFVYLLHWRWLVVVDAVLFVLWTAVFGVFGRMYIPAHPTPRQGGQWRMKRAVWVDLVEMLLWFLTLASGVWVFFRGGRERTLHTGRAVV